MEQEIEKSDTGREYKRVVDFMRLTRSIETYPNYAESGDIVELSWQEIKDSTDPGLGLVKELFQATKYKPIMLINATAQVALTHHLDDAGESSFLTRYG